MNRIIEANFLPPVEEAEEKARTLLGRPAASGMSGRGADEHLVGTGHVDRDGDRLTRRVRRPPGARVERHRLLGEFGRLTVQAIARADLGQPVVQLGIAGVEGEGSLARVLVAGRITLQVARGGQGRERGQGSRVVREHLLRLVGRRLVVLLIEPGS